MLVRPTKNDDPKLFDNFLDVNEDGDNLQNRQ